jgi:hypothetical protein
MGGDLLNGDVPARWEFTTLGEVTWRGPIKFNRPASSSPQLLPLPARSVRDPDPIDRSATAFLANLRAGEAVIIGVDFPIPLTVQIARPGSPPSSDGPDYQKAWSLEEDQ